MTRIDNPTDRSGHTLVELVAALIASALLLAGLGSVMLIARQIAYTPSAATHRLEAAKLISELDDELRLATFVTQRSTNLLEFVVADRNGDGTEERIRYEWSGTPGDPLVRSYNGGDPIVVLESVQDFQLEYVTQDITTTVETTTESAELLLQSNATIQSSTTRDITSTNWSDQRIDSATIGSGAPANALYWNATKVDFYGCQGAGTMDTLLVQLRSTGSPNNGPTSHVLAQATVPESTLTSGLGWNTAVFANPARGLALHRNYAVTWSASDSGIIAKLGYNDSGAGGVLESTDTGASWQFMSTRQMYYRLYGTYTSPGPTYDVTRSYLSSVAVRLQTSAQTHSRVDASISLTNLPELLSAYWRTDFDSDPTLSDVNGDGTADWQAAEAVEVAGAVPYNPALVVGGLWVVSGKLQTQPMNDFANPTTIEVRFRSTSMAGSSGAVVRINADWGNGLHAPLLAKLQKQPDGTQYFSLVGKSNDTTDVVLFEQSDLNGEFIRCRLTILPEHDLVNVCINDEDMDTFEYPTYAATTTDRLVAVYGDTTYAQFDYIAVRVSENN